MFYLEQNDLENISPTFPMGGDDNTRRRIVTGADLFANETEPNENNVRSFSMGSSSATQFEQGRRPQPGTRGVMGPAMGAPAGNNTDYMAMLQQNINIFGFPVPLYGLLVAALMAFMVWGVPGLLTVGFLYAVSHSFQGANQVQHADPQGMSPPGTNPPGGSSAPGTRSNVPRPNQASSIRSGTVAPSAPLRTSTNLNDSGSRFPGQAKRLG